MKHLKQTTLALALGQTANGSVLAQSNVGHIQVTNTVYPVNQAGHSESHKGDTDTKKVN